jgi:hypothetical protein
VAPAHAHRRTHVRSAFRESRRRDVPDGGLPVRPARGLRPGRGLRPLGGDAAPVRARFRMELLPCDRRRRPDRRDRVWSAARRVLRVANSRTARNERHGLLGVRG